MQNCPWKNLLCCPPASSFLCINCITPPSSRVRTLQCCFQTTAFWNCNLTDKISGFKDLHLGWAGRKPCVFVTFLGIKAYSFPCFCFPSPNPCLLAQADAHFPLKKKKMNLFLEKYFFKKKINLFPLHCRDWSDKNRRADRVKRK